MIPLSGPDRCAPAAERRGDQLAGTAAPVARWLLVEQAGHWGRDALASRMPPAVATELAAATATAGVRIVLIRRPGRALAADRWAWAYVDSRPGSEQTRWGDYADHGELLDGPLTGITGRPSDEAFYLVCAHGRHDACCAIRGRPVAAALAALRPGRVWECSHIGGDRFAANVIVLPEGLYYGHVTVDSAADVVAAYDAGEVLPLLLRGRSSVPAPVQAAQHHARLLLGDSGIAAWMPRQVDPAGEQTWRVVLAYGAASITLVVRAEAAPPERLTCSAGRPRAARVFRLVDWQPGSVG